MTAVTADPQTVAGGHPRRWKSTAAAATRRWWVFTSRPMSLRVAWRLSGVIDAKRVPGGSPLLAAAWWWSNRTDRLILFALAVLAPTILTGPILWCAVRPSRRLGLYAVVGVLWAVGAIAAGD